MRYDEVDNVVLALLRAQTDDDANPLSIGDGAAPIPEGEVVPDTPYAVLRPLPGGRDDGVMGDPHAQLYLLYEVRSVGELRESARRMAAAMRDAILDRTNTIAGSGWAVARSDHVVAGGVTLEGTLWNTVDEFGLLCVPT